MQLFKDTNLVLSGIAEGTTDCHCITTSGDVIPLPELESNIEETDVRLIPHSLHATKAMTKRIVIL